MGALWRLCPSERFGVRMPSVGVHLDIINSVEFTMISSWHAINIKKHELLPTIKIEI